MRKKNYKGRCEKRKLSKCVDVCKTYDAIQYVYADVLEADNDIIEIRCNVQLEGLEFTSNFACLKAKIKGSSFHASFFKCMNFYLQYFSSQYLQR